eukprot:GEMP01044119.1.p1 GENE.GEMP01044119.1~~GEMP01044119.1.p1  ORF type:complete len:262 (+),score=63.90 GEMP01044119.1:219-1004(+)
MECPQCISHEARPFTAYYLPGSGKCPACRGVRPPKVCAIQDTLQRFMQRLTAASPLSGEERKLCHASVKTLQQRMRKGDQQKEDFDIFGAWGNFRTVISLGGGPANDLFGTMMALEEVALRTKEGADINYFCFDWVDVWTPIVDKVGQLANRTIHTGHCDLALSLDDEENREVLRACGNGTECLFLLSFVILESSAVLAKDLLEAYPRAAFIILDAGQGNAQGNGDPSGSLALFAAKEHGREVESLQRKSELVGLFLAPLD